MAATWSEEQKRSDRSLTVSTKKNVRSMNTFLRSLGNDGEAAAMEVRTPVLGPYGRNRDQRTCVYQRSAFDEISHDRASTYD